MIVQTFPFVLVGFSILATYLAVIHSAPTSQASTSTVRNGEDVTTKVDYAINDLFLGLQDPIFWFLAPLFALVSLGTVVVVNYLAMTFLHILMGLYSSLNLFGRDRK